MIFLAYVESEIDFYLKVMLSMFCRIEIKHYVYWKLERYFTDINYNQSICSGMRQYFLLYSVRNAVSDLHIKMYIILRKIAVLISVGSDLSCSKRACSMNVVLHYHGKLIKQCWNFILKTRALKLMLVLATVKNCSAILLAH